MKTGYNIREGAAILAERRAEREREREAARREQQETVARLARRALDILDGRRAA